MYSTIEIEINEAIATIWLNRPEVRNAFNSVMVSELATAFKAISHNDEAKILILRGRGTIFCAGADLHWMKTLGESTYEYNLAESKLMAQCFYELSVIPKPVITIAHGSVMGGGIGLVAAADMAICSRNVTFAFSEVKLGLVPAIISPYVIGKIGNSKAKELMLTGNRFTGTEALAMNLVNWSVDESELEESMDSLVSQLLLNSPIGMKHTKNLINNLDNYSNYQQIIDFTAEIIAKARTSSDGQEGMNAFLEKRKPVWK